MKNIRKIILALTLTRSILAKLEQLSNTLPTINTKSHLTAINLAYFINFTNADIPTLKFTPTPGTVEKLTYSSFDSGIPIELMGMKLIEARKMELFGYNFMVKGFNPSIKLCSEMDVLNTGFKLTWSRSLTEEQCSKYKLVSMIADLPIEKNVRIYAQDGNLVAMIGQKKEKISDANFSDDILLASQQIFISTSVQRPSVAGAYQRASDADGNFNEPFFFLMQGAEILNKLDIFEDTKCDGCKVEWMNYNLVDRNYGFLWVRVKSKDNTSSYYFFTLDQFIQNKLTFRFSFNQVDDGFIGINQKKDLYFEVNGIKNTVNVCLFFQKQDYTSYKNFIKSCTLRNVKIDLKAESEYIDRMQYRADGAILVEIISKKNATERRYAWSYNATKIQPEIDFEGKIFMLDEDVRREFNKSYLTEPDGVYHEYKTNSTSYNIVYDQPQKIGEKLSLQVEDKESKINIEFNFTKIKFFFEDFVDVENIQLEIDEEGAFVEYVNRPKEVRGDRISMDEIVIGNSSLKFSPIILSQPYMTKSYQKKSEEKKLGYNPEILLDYKGIHVYKASNLLHRMMISPENATSLLGNPYFARIDLTYLNIEIDTFLSSNQNGILLIKDFQSRFHLMKVYSNLTYEIREFTYQYDTFGEDSRFNKKSEKTFVYYIYTLVSETKTLDNTLMANIRAVYPIVSLNLTEKLDTEYTIAGKKFEISVKKRKNYNKDQKVEKFKNILVPDRNSTNLFNLRDYVQISGNNYFVDGSVIEAPDLQKNRIRIVSNEQKSLDFGKIRVHSFIEGKIDNVSVVIHHVGRDECAPSSYQVFVDNQPATAEVDILKEADFGFFDQIIWNEQFYVVVVFGSAKGQIMVDMVSLQNIEKRSKGGNSLLATKASLTASFDNIYSKKLRISGSKSNLDSLYIFSQSYENSLSIYIYSIKDKSITLKSVTANSEDFDIIKTKHHILVITLYKNSLNMVCYNKRDLSLVKDFAVQNLIFSTPKFETSRSLSCRDPQPEEPYDFDCTLQTDDYDLYNFYGSFLMNSPTKGSIQNSTFHLYNLPYLFNLGWCSTSRNFISCELSIKKNIDLRITNSSLFIESLVSFPKKNGKYEGEGFTSRMKAVNKTLICSNKNFAPFDSVNDGFLSHKINVFSGKSHIFRKNLTHSINLLVNFTDGPDHANVIEDSKFILGLNLRYNETVEFGKELFKFKEAERSYTWIIFACLGFIVICAILVVFICKGEDDGEGEDKWEERDEEDVETESGEYENDLYQRTTNKGTLKFSKEENY